MKINSTYADSLIIGHEWHVSLDYGLSQLNSYLHRLELLKMDKITLKDLSFGGSGKDAAYKVENGIAVIALNGVMRVEDGLCSDGIKAQISMIEQANSDVSVRDILFYVNSGGGESVAGTMLHNAIKDSNKPVYVLGELIASAAYNAALPAKAIFLSSSMAKAGSIGTMIALNKKQLQKYKDNFTEYYSSVSPDKNKSWRSLMDGDATELQNSITENAVRFQEKVKEYRKVEAMALSGGDYYSEQAMEYGLIDGIKTMSETISYIVGQRTNKTNTILITKNNTMNLLDRVNRFFGFSAANENQVIESMNGVAGSLTELQDAIREEVTTELQDAHDAELKAANERGDSATAELIALRATIESQANELAENKAQYSSVIEDLTNQFNAAKAVEVDLNAKILELTGSRRSFEQNRKTDQFEPENNFVDGFGNVKVTRSNPN